MTIREMYDAWLRQVETLPDEAPIPTLGLAGDQNAKMKLAVQKANNLVHISTYDTTEDSYRFLRKLVCLARTWTVPPFSDAMKLACYLLLRHQCLFC